PSLLLDTRPRAARTSRSRTSALGRRGIYKPSSEALWGWRGQDGQRSPGSSVSNVHVALTIRLYAVRTTVSTMLWLGPCRSCIGAMRAKLRFHPMVHTLRRHREWDLSSLGPRRTPPDQLNISGTLDYRSQILRPSCR